MKKLAWLIALLSIASTGCDKLGPVFGLSGEPARPRLTGAIKGKIVDQNGDPIAGAKVSNGAAVFYSSDGTSKSIVKDDLWGTVAKDKQAEHEMGLTKGEFVLTKVAGNATTLVMAEFNGVYSQAIQVYVNAATFDNTATENGLTLVDGEIKVPTFGPVPGARDTALEYVSNSLGNDALEGTSAASPSTSISFPNSGVVSLKLQAPVGGKGATVKGYRVTYYPLEADLSNLSAATPISTEIPEGLSVNPVSRTLTVPVLIQPATNTRSGPESTVGVNVVSTDASFNAYLRAKSELKAYVELLNESGSILKNRDDATISTTVTIRLKE